MATTVVFYLVLAAAVAELLVIHYRQRNRGKYFSLFNYVIYILLIISYVLTAPRQTSQSFAVSTVMVVAVMVLAWFLQRDQK